MQASGLVDAPFGELYALGGSFCVMTSAPVSKLVLLGIRTSPCSISNTPCSFYSHVLFFDRLLLSAFLMKSEPCSPSCLGLFASGSITFCQRAYQGYHHTIQSTIRLYLYICAWPCSCQYPPISYVSFHDHQVLFCYLSVHRRVLCRHQDRNTTSLSILHAISS